jgi:DNA polymerase-1
MNTPELLDDLLGRGFTLTAEGENIRVAPWSKLTDELRESISRCKAELLALLSNPRPTVRPSDVSDTTPTVPFVMVTYADGLAQTITAIDNSRLVGADTETAPLPAFAGVKDAALDPQTGRVRLLQLAPDSVPMVFVLDLFTIDGTALAPLWEALASRELIFHNGLFDLGFLERLGFAPGRVWDTMLLSRLHYGSRDPESGKNRPKGFHGLKECAARELGRPLDKAEQVSDWSAEHLTVEQLAYAAADADVLLPLHKALSVKIKAADLWSVSNIENRCLPAVAWLSGSGVALDRPAWEALAAAAEAEAARLAAELDALAPPRPGDDPRWNWNSWQQILQAFALLGINAAGTSDAVLAGIVHPLAAKLRELRAVRKLVGVYGSKWLENVATDGRVYADWRQLGSDAGRMSCSGPNLQQLPRDKRYRRCFIAPPGRVLVKADYSQIELRIAAKISGDKELLDVYQRKDDVHTLTARAVLGVSDITDEQRQLAKVMNFGLLYGMGAKGFRAYAKTSYGVELTEQEARRYRHAFFKTYSGLDSWHQREQAAAVRGFWKPAGAPPDETRTLAGRRRFIGRKDPVTFRLNSPVQGTGADGLKRALARLWKRRAECPGAFPVLVVHDEIVIECDEAQAGAAAAWLRQAMLDGMAPLIDPVPVVVDVKVGRNWGDTVPVEKWLSQRPTADGTDKTDDAPETLHQTVLAPVVSATGEGEAPAPSPDLLTQDPPAAPVHFLSQSCEWATPQDLFDALSARFGPFTLDACATADNAKCAAYFTRSDDGLSQPWTGRVWCNPPYGRGIGLWLKKALESVRDRSAELVVCLVPARTDTKWWHDYAAEGEVEFLKGRIHFNGAASGAPFPSALVVFRRDAAEPTIPPPAPPPTENVDPELDEALARFRAFKARPNRRRKKTPPADAGPASEPPPPPVPPSPVPVTEGDTAADALNGEGPPRLAPPLKWHGGKQPLARRIVGLMPPHTHYVEPYFGGGAVLLAKDPEGVSEVANDLNGDLATFWRVLQDPDAFTHFLRLAAAVPFSEQEWQDARDGLRDRPDADPVRRAAWFFVACRQSMAGRMAEFSPLSRSRTRRGQNEQASAWLTAVEGLPAVHERLRRVVILNRPALEVIRSQDGPGTLFYCDPPYLPQTRTSPDVYVHEMTEEDHRRLLELLRSCEGKVMLSGYPSPLYAEALTGWSRHTFDVANHAAGARTKGRETEVLWCNW